MTTTYIIGAGCTNNYQKGRRPRISNLPVPMDTNFFKVSAKILSEDPKYSHMFFDLFKEIYKQFYPTPDRKSTSARVKLNDMKEILNSMQKENKISLENVFSVFDTQVNFDMNQNPKYLKELTKLIAITLNESLMGDICEQHLKLTDIFENGDAVINYNYDIVMDNALFTLAYFNEKSYNIPFNYIIENNELIRSDYRLSFIELIKPHGSLNWTKCNTCGNTFLFKYKKIGTCLARIKRIGICLISM